MTDESGTTESDAVAKRYQVFVSSTFNDLEEERQHVTRALLRMNCIPSGMELFPASDDDQWTLIRHVIDDCDYFIVIISGKYGSVNADGISFTEMEYDYAIDRKKPVLAFPYKEPSRLPGFKLEDDDEKRRKLAAFREKATKNKMVDFWESPPDLASKVKDGIVELKKTRPDGGWVRAAEAEKAQSRLAKAMRQVKRLRSRNKALEQPLTEELTLGTEPITSLPAEAITILKEAADKRGRILAGTDMDGWELQAGNLMIREADNPRFAATYKDLIERLHLANCIRELSEGLYELTEEGYRTVESKNNSTREQESEKNEEHTIYKFNEWSLTFMGQDSTASICQVPPDAAKYMQYYFKFSAFNSTIHGTGLYNLKIEFSEAGQLRFCDDGPGEYTGEVQAGGEYDPPFTVLSLPAREWVSKPIRGIIPQDSFGLIKLCDEAYFTADTTGGQHIKELIAVLTK
jgi:Domain of unknown function (DUF4062)